MLITLHKSSKCSKKYNKKRSSTKNPSKKPTPHQWKMKTKTTPTNNQLIRSRKRSKIIPQKASKKYLIFPSWELTAPYSGPLVLTKSYFGDTNFKTIRIPKSSVS